MSASEGPVKRKEEDESAREMIEKVTKSEGNECCADCGDINPQWASVNFGVFICINCAGIHRSLGNNVSKVRSVRLDTWTEDMVKSVSIIGNKKAKEHYEAKVPACWLPPKPNSRHILHEQWIRAKYERMEFVPEIHEVKRSYTAGTRQGFLSKRKKDSDEWRKRWFVLATDKLSYFLSYQDKNPKNSIPLSHLNATLQAPGLEDKWNSMLIAYHDLKTRKTRNIFVYADSGKDIMDWFCAIRMAKIKLLQETFPERPQQMIATRASRDFVHFGYLEKMPSSQNKWQKRFFVLDQNSLRYYVHPTDPHGCGEIILGSSLDGYCVDEELPGRLGDRMHSFMLHVPKRGGGGFPLVAGTAIAKEKWMEVLQKMIMESTGIVDESVAPNTYEDDDDLYSSIEELKIK